MNVCQSNYLKGGHTKHASYRTFLDNMTNVGEDEAVKLAQIEYDCMIAVHEFIKEKNIDCDGVRCDTVDIFYDQAQLDIAKQAVPAMKKAMGADSPATKYTFHDAESAASILLTPHSFGALQYEAGSLSAYKLTIGILKLALENGLNLQTNTPVRSIEKDIEENATSWTVHTDRGSIVAKNLILATNGYTAHLYPPLQGMVVPFRGIITAHRPGQKMPQHGLPTTYSFIYEKGYEYMIARPAGSINEGDIIMGGGLTKGQGPDGLFEYGNTDDTTLDADIVSYLKDTTPTFFGENWGEDHPEGRIRHTWSGIMGYSADGYPLVGPVPGEEGLFLDVSFQGHGMVLCFLCAKAATQMILGADGKELDRWFPKCFRVSEERIKKRFGGKVKVNKATEVALKD